MLTCPSSHCLDCKNATLSQLFAALIARRSALENPARRLGNWLKTEAWRSMESKSATRKQRLRSNRARFFVSTESMPCGLRRTAYSKRATQAFADLHGSREFSPFQAVAVWSTGIARG